MDNRSKPQITASLSLSPTTHSYANSQAPDLNLTLTSQYPDPITIYADNPSPTLMLKCGAFIIIDLANGCEVKRSKSTHCRIPPPTKVPVPLNERLFHTLLPHTPLTLSAPFTRSRSSTGGKPLAKDDPDYTRDRSAKSGACGVDGLEPGRDYALTLAPDPRVLWSCVRWWEYGTREQVLNGEGNEVGGLDGRKVKFGHGPHDAIELDLTNVGAVVFHCQD